MDENNNQFDQQDQQPVTPEAVDDGKGMSIAALVLGILGIVGAWIPVVRYFTLVCAVLGIIFGVKGRAKATAAGVPTGLATAGFVLGIIGTACEVIGIICAIAAASAAACALAGMM